jgi:hypothetical protein
MDSTIPVFVNPLQLLEVDEPWASMSPKPPTADDIFKFMCTPGVPSDLDSLTARYKEISQEKARLFAVPDDQRILEKLVWPLRHAKASYVVGNFLSTIALCGAVAEMMALFLFEISVLEGIEVKDSTGSAVMSKAFERERQVDRLKILLANNLIGADLKTDFDLIRTTRRKYQHLWSQDHASLQADSLAVFISTVAVVVGSLGLSMNAGKVVLKPAVLKYLQKQGLYQPT